MDFHEVSPAYGRDYRNQKEVKAGYAAGHDFRSLMTGQYVNKDDHPEDMTLLVRYNRGMGIMSIKPPKKGKK